MDAVAADVDYDEGAALPGRKAAASNAMIEVTEKQQR